MLHSVQLESGKTKQLEKAKEKEIRYTSKLLKFSVNVKLPLTKRKNGKKKKKKKNQNFLD